jgi:3-(3-hydroxy-phenyl)propionate hydroxylase
MKEVDSNGTLVADGSMALKDRFTAEDAGVAILRPDRFAAAVCRPQDISETIIELGKAMRLPPI